MVDKYGNPWPKFRVYPPKILWPLRAVRHKCLDCCCEQTEEVQLCPVHDCPLWPFRFGRFPADHVGPRTVLPAIKEKCKDCAPEPALTAVRDCPKKCCPVWPYRLGSSPKQQSRKPPPKEAAARGQFKKGRGKAVE